MPNGDPSRWLELPNVIAKVNCSGQGALLRIDSNTVLEVLPGNIYAHDVLVLSKVEYRTNVLITVRKRKTDK